MTDPTEHELASKVRRMFYDARDARRGRVDQWVENYQLTMNQVYQSGRPTWEPSPAVAEIWPVIASLVAWETDSEPNFDATPVADEDSMLWDLESQLAEDLKTCLNAVWWEEGFDEAIAVALWDTHMYGVGFTKTTWNNRLVGGLGDVSMRRVDPFRMYVDPDATSFRDAQYIIETYELSWDQVVARWPSAESDLGSPGGEDSEHAPSLAEESAVSKPSKVNLGSIGGQATGPYGQPGAARARAQGKDGRYLVLEAWIREARSIPLETGNMPEDPVEKLDEANGKRPEPTNLTWDGWRCVVVVGDMVVEDCPAEDLWSHGEHPYDRIPYVDLGEFYGPSLVEILAPIQVSINRTLSRFEKNLDLIGNPVWVEDTRSGLTRTKVTNRPGIRLQVNPGSQQRWMEPPAIAPQNFQMVQFYIHEMERISGLTAMISGATPTGRNAQGVLDSVQDAALVRIRQTLRNLERMLRGAGRKAAALIAEFYDTPRFVAVVGEDGEKSSLAIGGQHFYTPTNQGRLPLRFQLSITAGSAMATSRAARMAEADTLFAMGAIDAEAVLKVHRFPGWRDTVKRQRELQVANGTLGQPPGARAAAGRLQ